MIRKITMDKEIRKGIKFTYKNPSISMKEITNN